jgi:hypothetical protein
MPDGVGSRLRSDVRSARVAEVDAFVGLVMQSLVSGWLLLATGAGDRMRPTPDGSTFRRARPIMPNHVGVDLWRY